MTAYQFQHFMPFFQVPWKRNLGQTWGLKPSAHPSYNRSLAMRSSFMRHIGLN